MSKRNSAAPHTPLRRSPRLLHQTNNPHAKTDSKERCRSDDGLRRSARLGTAVAASNPKKDSQEQCILGDELRRSARLSTAVAASNPKKDSQEQCKSGDELRRSARLSTAVAASNPKKESQEQCVSGDELRRSARLNTGVAASQSLRRSPRFSVSDYNRCVSNKRGGKAEVGVNSRRIKSLVSSVVESKVEEIEGSRFIIVLGLKASGKGEGGETNEGGVIRTSEEIIRECRKRKRGDEGNGSRKIQGWTKEQEIALQRAYYATKPTPHFWKKVAKLVPGKSAQECFDKVHSDHITPPQHPPRSRAKKTKFSSLAHFSLSASKLLKPAGLKIKRSSCHKQRSHLGQKNIRQLLQKKCHVEQDYEADLFSVLEPNINSSSQVNEQNDGLLSTPKRLQEKQNLLQKSCENSSGRKKPLSRFSGSCGMTLVSPPVLKQVKNRALHEKYIDQLHCREAKRKAACAHTERLNSGKENRKEINGPKTDVIKAAKSALVTDAQNAITQFQQLHANTMSESSDTDVISVDCDDDEGEIEV